MYEYRQVIHRMRMGESDRIIAQTKAGWIKCGRIRVIAGQQGRLAKGSPLHDPACPTRPIPYLPVRRHCFS
ncbi:MAG: hypothetical protein NTV33_13720 [Coprothermobacterota bacterium]|nr:hypothetical protein [Coprothermobacterota bacterium]